MTTAAHATPAGGRVIKLADLDAPLERVELPSRGGTPGRVAQVVELDVGGYAMLREFRETQDETPLFGLVRRAIPDLTEAELAELKPMHCLAIIAVASNRADAVVAQLAAVAGDGTPAGNGRPARRTGRARRMRAISTRSAPSPSASPGASAGG